MISVRFEPPRENGTPEERLRALEQWAVKICEMLNVMIEEQNEEASARLNIAADAQKEGDHV